MTAELIIMNKEAIALAADSAATISTGKIYPTNKVFMLSKFCPVGIMIYGNGEIMRVPWEPIIKLFRDHISNDDPYKDLEDYAVAFIEFLDKNKYLFPEYQQNGWFGGMVSNHFTNIKNDYDRRIKILENAGVDIEGSVKTIEIKSCIDKLINKLENEDVVWNTISHAHRNWVQGVYYDIISEIRDEIFDDIQLDNESRRKLELIAALGFYRHATGIVIAGFGVHNLFPVVVSYAVGGLVDNRLVYQKLKRDEMSFKKDGMIIPFAQSDVIDTFLNGIDPEFNEYLHEKVFPTVFESQDLLINSILKDLKKLKRNVDDDTFLKELQSKYGQFKNRVKPTLDKFKNNMMDIKVLRNRYPMISAVGFLPKDELAVMAESLLTLTSLKRRYSLDSLESVGGDIDVAVISKSDGFVWIKRKHYFDKKLNHHFFYNYFEDSKKRKNNCKNE